ncbi:hypothetical protein L3Q82_001436 [Scortum barcoo]|uniref:Uncharacterized protein n=1 Tax=Scortum barcoo TaxID=214431 RepID=A0ACB8WAK8_9TELE|nr:hypothetical protein L3Q82_001436 [Scortum barcoo]
MCQECTVETGLNQVVSEQAVDGPSPLDTMIQRLQQEQDQRLGTNDVSASVNTRSSREEHQGPLRRPDWRYRGPTLEPGLGFGARRRAPGGRVFAHGTRPGSARNGGVGPPSVGSHHPQEGP